MKILEKIKSFFIRKSADSVPATVKPDRIIPERDINRKDDEPKAQSKIVSVTEASLCRTSYGIGKLREDGSNRYLIFPEKMEVRYIPFVENSCIEAVYTIDPQDYIQENSRRFVYRIIDSAQFFMLSKEQKSEISSDLKKRGIEFRFPEEIDNYSAVMNILRDSEILLKNQDAGWFDKEKFLSDVAEIKGSNQYKELHLIRLKNGQRFILIINQIIPNVIEYGPSFMNLYEPGAVKISYQDGYAYIAPFGRPK